MPSNGHALGIDLLNPGQILRLIGAGFPWHLAIVVLVNGGKEALQGV